MKLAVKPEKLGERLALELGVVPTPLIETWYGFMLARTVMVATKCGIFDALADGAHDAAQVARQCGTHPRSTEKLLVALAGAGYVRSDGERFSLTAVSRRWLLRDAPSSFHDKMLFQFLEWDWWSRCEEFVRSGKPVAIHESMSGEDWALYQRGMRAGKDRAAAEVARRLPVPPRAERMLDVGGSHGIYSVALCRRHRRLSATILDLPSAIEHAAPLLARERMGERVQYQPGDALTAELPADHYDVVFIGSLVHHFDAATNRALVARIVRSLRRGGILAILEVLRSRQGEVRQLGGLLDLYFAMTSASGTWSAEEIASWQAAAGLTPLKTIQLRAAPNVAIQVGRK